MCLIALAWGASPDYPLVIAANRDEVYDRPTAALAQWITPAGHTIVSGRDLKDGGTWMGFAPNGRFAMLTNVRNPLATAPQGAPSRGELVVAWLSSALEATPWCAERDLAAYAGFNLILGDWTRQQCHYACNQSSSQALHGLQPGQIYGLSNASLNTPWPKTQWLKAQLEDRLKNIHAGQTHTTLAAQLLDSLRHSEPASAEDLPQTGVGSDLESALSSVFVRYPLSEPSYGTRSSLCAVLGTDAALHLTETSYAAPEQTVQTTLRWPN